LGVVVACLAWWFPPGNPSSVTTAPQQDQVERPPTSTTAPRLAPTPSVTPAAESPGDQIETWPGYPAGSQYFAASVEMHNDPTSHLDFEDGDTSSRPLSGFDAVRLLDGLGGINGAVMAHAGGERPTLETCARIAESKYAPLIENKYFETPTYFCIHTNEGRYGWLRTSFVDPGTFRSDFGFSYVIWKMPGDE